MTSQPATQVLIVDDDRGICSSLSRILRMEGYATASVEDGRQALEYLRTHPAPRLILLDLMMPNMNGWEFSREQQRDPNLSKIPVVIISAGGSEVRRTAGTIPAIEYLEKPLDLERLLRIVGDHCAAKS
jgi:two-component system, chemotaxis family, chemotaxis protein CheY